MLQAVCSLLPCSSKNYLNESLVAHRTDDEVNTMLVVKAKIKDYATGYNIAGDFAEALDQKVAALIKDAVKRAEGNGRRTVMAKDL